MAQKQKDSYEYPFLASKVFVEVHGCGPCSLVGTSLTTVHTKDLQGSPGAQHVALIDQKSEIDESWMKNMCTVLQLFRK